MKYEERQIMIITHSSIFSDEVFTSVIHSQLIQPFHDDFLPLPYLVHQEGKKTYPLIRYTSS